MFEQKKKAWQPERKNKRVRLLQNAEYSTSSSLEENFN